MTKHDNVSQEGIMKATEFVKRFGWNITKYNLKYHLNESEKLVYMDWILSVEDVDDLKRIVESHELVERCGGLNSLKAWVKETKSKLSLATYFHCNKPLVLIQIEKAEQAIADVEACHEVN